MTEWATEQYAKLKQNGVSMTQLAGELKISRSALSRLMHRDNHLSSSRARVEEAVNFLIGETSNDH